MNEPCMCVCGGGVRKGGGTGSREAPGMKVVLLLNMRWLNCLQGQRTLFWGPDIPPPPLPQYSTQIPCHPPTPPSLLCVSWTLISMAATFLWMEESARGMGIEVPRRFLLWDEDSTHFFCPPVCCIYLFSCSMAETGTGLDWQTLPLPFC